MRLIQLVVAGAFFAVLGFGVYVFLVVLPRGGPPDCEEVALPTSAEWTATEEFDRYEVAGELHQCDLMIGLTEAEVEAAVGPPDETDRTGQTDQTGGERWHYGFSRGEWDLDFAADGTVAESDLSAYGAGQP